MYSSIKNNCLAIILVLKVNTVYNGLIFSRTDDFNIYVIIRIYICFIFDLIVIK